MIDVITSQNARLYRRAIDDMHAMRYRVFVEKWGWDIPGVKEGYEKDKFDTDDTIHLVKIDEDDGSVVASIRFNPSLRPHLLTDVFPHACAVRGVPVGPTIYESSRFAIDTEKLKGRKLSKVRGEVLSGSV